MRTIFSSVLLGILGATTSVAQTTQPSPTLWVSTGEIKPGCVMEFRFPKPVVAEADLGTHNRADVVKVGPALQGTLTWTMPNVARFELTAPPATGAMAAVSVNKDQKYLDGTAIPAVPIGRMKVESFRLEYETIPDRYNDDYNPRLASYFLRFNSEVDPTKIAPFFIYEDANGQKLAAKVTPVDDKQSRYLRKTLAQRFAASLTEPTPEATEESDDEIEGEPEGNPKAAVLVSPVNPLPIGEKWSLVLMAGLPDATGKEILAGQRNLGIGNITPLQVESASASVTAGGPRQITVFFNKNLPEGLTPEILGKHVKITPEPADLKWKIQHGTATATADFSSQDPWEVSVDASPEIVAADGTLMTGGFTGQVKFYSLPPNLSLPVYRYETQLSKGSRTYPIKAVNMSSVKVRVKYLAGENAIRAVQGYRFYTGRSSSDDDGDRVPQTLIPYELVQGQTLYNKEWTVDLPRDAAFSRDLNWNEILTPLGADKRLGPGMFFVDVQADPSKVAKDTLNPKAAEDPLNPKGDGIGFTRAQRIVQLTDLGLAWKFNENGALLYVYSCETGKPVPDATVHMFANDARPLSSMKTDANGLVKLPRPKDATHIQVEKDADTCILPYDSSLNSVYLWNFPVRIGDSPGTVWSHRLFMFTDRNLYKPGELMRLKGYARLQRDTQFTPPVGETAKLRIEDEQETVVHTQDLKFGEDGEFDMEYRFPASKVGNYAIYVEFDRKKPENDETYWEEQDRKFSLPVSVQDFRRNTFEITSKIPEIKPGQTEFPAHYQANYYLGQPLSESALTWTLSSKPTGFYPEAFRDYYFGDHSCYDSNYWLHYFGYEEPDFDEESAPTDRQVGKGKLDAKGAFVLPVKLAASEFPVCRAIGLSVEITDKNQQTLHKRDQLLFHPSSIYAGLSRQDDLKKTGQPVTYDVVAVTPTGEKVKTSQLMNLKVEKLTHDTIRVETANGVTTKSEERRVAVTSSDLTFDPAKPRNEFTFTPSEQGEYVVTCTGKDSAGLPFQTVTTQTVYGAGEFSWEYENGMRIRLVPEKKLFKAGEVARLLVLTPVDGTALITVERTGVIRTFLQELKSDKPLVEIPLDAADAPNVFVSVLLIKGSKDSLREHKEPVLKLGYCELLVEPETKALAVTLNPSRPEIRPGEEAAISGRVVDSTGTPVANASLVVYAEDEGVLSVMGYENPQPLTYFQAPVNLGLETGVSLNDFMPEDPQQVEYTFKGMTIGGGGFVELPDNARKNFTPCAYWNPSVKTDQNGAFTVSFTTPDTLTRYRVIAVAVSGSDRFGTAQADLTVDKPIMLEPVVPRHANQGDKLVPKVMVHNKTDREGVWKVTLQTGSETRFSVGGLSDRSHSVELSLKAHESKTVPFFVELIDDAEAKWVWEITPVSLANGTLDEPLHKDLSDKVVSQFPVSYPRPLMHEERYYQLSAKNPAISFEKDFPEELVKGRGAYVVQVSSNPLIEAGATMKYLLHYPYGCVEQTCSSLMPWYAAKDLSRFIPSFNKSDEEIKTNIQDGADRLISMQTPSGGLSYWPGGSTPTDWACGYGGIALVMARNHGAFVPDTVIDKLANYTIKHLSNQGSETSWDRDARSLALYFLALAGKPQENWYDVEQSNAKNMSEAGAAWLALAMNESGGDAKARAAAFLAGYRSDKANDSSSWMGDGYYTGVMLLARATVLQNDPEADSVFARLLAKRNRTGHWGNTFNNSWSLQALAAWSKNLRTPPDKPVDIALSGANAVKLDEEHPSAELRLPLGAKKGPALTLTGDASVFARVTLESKPEIQPLPSAEQGISISREYVKVSPDGTTGPAKDLRIGDVIRVTLKIRATKAPVNYLVIDDPLPSILEAINPEFASQNTGAATAQNDWWTHYEMRDDRVVFFSDYFRSDQESKLTYLARVTGEGVSQVPPALAEAMYSPETRGLSSTMEISAKPKEVAARTEEGSAIVARQ